MERCKALLKALEGGAVLVHRPENVRWLTGFTGEGCAFISAAGSAIVTDFRYVEQASRQAARIPCEQTGNGRSEAQVVRELCARWQADRLYVETDFLTYDGYKTLEAALPGVDLLPLSGRPQELRMIKDPGEIECIKRAAAISCEAFEHLLGMIHAGMTEKEVQILLDHEMLRLGSEGNAFDTIAAAGVNGSLPHAVPSDHVIQNGELLTLDFGARFGGYCADMTRTIGFGRVSSELRVLHGHVLKAQQMALDAVRPGAVCGEIDAIARDYLDAIYPGAFGHSLGHGVGLFIHEQPRLAKGSTTVLQPGHVVTVEPGVYIPGLGGCRIEDMTIITGDGCIDPVTIPRELIEL